MKLGIKVVKIEDGSYLASVDWTKGDGGKVGTPGCIAYGSTEIEAYETMQNKLEGKGHEIIDLNK